MLPDLCLARRAQPRGSGTHRWRVASASGHACPHPPLALPSSTFFCVLLDSLPACQVLTRLTDRRIAVEKELAALGEAKKGAQDIFRHCRGFERAYSLMLQVGLG